MQYEPENVVLRMDPGMEEGIGSPEADEQVDRGIRWGRAGLLLWLLLGILGAELCLMFHEPGAGIGVFGICLLGILLLARDWTALSRWQAGGIVLLVVSVMQSVVHTSLSNVLVMGSVLLLLSGERAHGGQVPLWRSWAEGLLSGFRPLAAVIRAFQVMGTSPFGGRELGSRLSYLLSILVPVGVLLLVFGILLSGGNAVMGNLIGNWIDAVERFLLALDLPSLDRWFMWGFFGGICLMLVCPGGVTCITGMLAMSWPHLGSSSGKLRLHQWIAILVSLNILFLVSTVTDVVFLWLSRELPEGVNHSRYLHSGVYALILTTLLSAFILGTLTQHTDRVREHRIVLGLSYLWMLQNLVLISGVFLRLWIYIDAYGYTPKRIYVSLFLCLVLAGYSILTWALINRKDFKWLVAVNLVLVFAYFSIIQFIDVRRIVVELNMPLYQSGDISFPEELHLHQIGSHKVPYLIHILRNPQSVEDAELAKSLLGCSLNPQSPTGWQSFQLGDHWNRVLLQEFLGKKEE